MNFYKCTLIFADCAVKWNKDWVKMELMILEITLSLKELIGTTLAIVSVVYKVAFIANESGLLEDQKA